MAATALSMFVVMVMPVFMVMMVLLCMVHDFMQHLGSQGVTVLHNRQELIARKLVPWSGYDARVGIVCAEHGNNSLQAVIFYKLGTGEQNRTSVFNLIEEELTEVLDIHFCFLRICDRNKAVERYGLLLSNILYSGDDIGQLADTGRLDDDAVRVIGFDDLLECFAKISNQRAANTAGIHFGDLNACIFEESAVNADFSKLVFNQHNLFAAQSLGQQALNECCFTGAEKAGYNINFRHKKASFLRVNNRC